MMEAKIVETERDLRIRIEELRSEINSLEIHLMGSRRRVGELQRLVDAGPLINEEQYLQEVTRQQYINTHLVKRLKERGAQFRCNWCGSVKKKASIWWHEDTKEILFLCFSACMKFPEPFRDTKAGEKGWHRIDPWQDYKREYPRLRKDSGYKIARAPGKQVKLGA